MNASDDGYYLMVATELSKGIRDEGLWMKAFALENGDEVRTKAHYARLRATKLAQENAVGVDDVQTPRSDTVKSTRDNRPETNHGASKSGRPFLKVLLTIIVVVAIGIFIKAYYSRGNAHTAPSEAETKPAEKIVEPQLSESELASSGIRFEKKGAYTYIYLDGDITPQMASLFGNAINDPRYLQPMDMLIVNLNSSGGDLYAAMSIGRALKKRDEARKDRGIFVKPEAKCYSACVFVLAAGLQRVRQGSIGIHRPYLLAPKDDINATSKWLEKVAVDAKAYLREMGVSETLYDHMVNVPPDKILTFSTVREMDQYGLLGVDPAFEERKAAIYMQSRGISSRQEYNARKSKADESCVDSKLVNENIAECYERIMRGG